MQMMKKEIVMTDQILETVQAIEPELIAIRHDLHAHPETGFEEHRTSAIVAAKLRGWVSTSQTASDVPVWWRR
jgi:metal-dependent amidase/aminoacylase/carboxypeptidase family protein